MLAYFGLLKIGAIPISLNVMLKADEIAFIAADASAAIVVADESLAGQPAGRGQMPSVRHLVVVGEAPDGALPWDEVAADSEPLRAVDLDREATAAILYTSGTTRKPKGAMLSHANVVANSNATVHHLRMTSDDRLLCALPLFHVFGQNFILNASVTAASTLVLHERFAPDEIVGAIPDQRISVFTVSRRCTSTCSTTRGLRASWWQDCGSASRRRRRCPRRSPSDGTSASGCTSSKATG